MIFTAGCAAKSNCFCRWDWEGPASDANFSSGWLESPVAAEVTWLNWSSVRVEAGIDSLTVDEVEALSTETGPCMVRMPLTSTSSSQYALLPAFADVSIQA